MVNLLSGQNDDSNIMNVCSMTMRICNLEVLSCSQQIIENLRN